LSWRSFAFAIGWRLAQLLNAAPRAMTSSFARRLLVAAALVVAVASAAACSSGPSQTTFGKGTASVRLDLTLWQWQMLEDTHLFPFLDYVLAGPNFTASGSFNSDMKSQISGVIAGVPVGSGYTLKLTTKAFDGSWSCAGMSRPFAAGCGPFDARMRLLLTCESGFVHSWHRAPVIVNMTVDCASTDAGADSGADAQPETGADACIAMTRAEACGSNNCGAAPDGCGGVLQCGSCASDQTCRIADGGTGGTCVATCQAATMCPPGQDCGTAPDGCGGTLNCGSCPSGQLCSASGVCVCAPDCTGKTCGPDACGGTCGTCMTGDTCDGSGQCISGCASNNNGAPCTPTEQRFLSKSVDCYNCLVSAGCLNDAIFGDVLHECGDVPGNAANGAKAGTPRSTLCLATIDCVLQTNCSSSDVAICYCGSLGVGTSCTQAASGANGPCMQQEIDALEHVSSDTPAIIAPDYYNQNLGGGKANQIFSCANNGNVCPMCLQ
jgi:hypothetical protein